MARTAFALLALTFLLPSWAHADPAADEAILKKAGVGTEGPALLKFLQGSVPREGGTEEIGPLVKALGSEDFFEREEAFKKVIVLGPRALPFLRAVLKEGDRELVIRAEVCLKIIEGGPGADVHGAVLRQLGLRKPEGAAGAILEYLPFAPNDRLAEEATLALTEVALEGGKPAAALVAALADKFPARRGAAAEVLAKHAFAAHGPAIGKLLADPDPMVRMKAGIALAFHLNQDAIPVLIDLLETLPPGPAAHIETLLNRLAAFKGPSGSFASAKGLRDAWTSWWNANVGSADLARLTTFPKLLGKTLLIHSSAGRVEEIGPDGKVLWQVDGLKIPVTAQLLDDERFVVLESNPRRIAVRSTKGAVVKSLFASLQTDVQALPGGNFLVTSRTALSEYNRDGVLVKGISVSGTQAVSARKLPSGKFVCLTSAGLILQLNAAGKEIARFPVGAAVVGNGLDVIPEGRILLTDAGAGRVLEFDATGTLKREWKVPGASSAVRLANGNTLVACGGAEKVVEINDRGVVVWEHSTRGSHVLRASKR